MAELLWVLRRIASPAWRQIKIFCYCHAERESSVGRPALSEAMIVLNSLPDSIKGCLLEAARLCGCSADIAQRNLLHQWHLKASYLEYHICNDVCMHQIVSIGNTFPCCHQIFTLNRQKQHILLLQCWFSALQKDMKPLPITPATEVLYRQDSSIGDQNIGSGVANHIGDSFNMTPAKKVSLISNFEAMPTNPLAYRQSPQLMNDPGLLSSPSTVPADTQLYEPKDNCLCNWLQILEARNKPTWMSRILTADLCRVGLAECTYPFHAAENSTCKFALWYPGLANAALFSWLRQGLQAVTLWPCPGVGTSRPFQWDSMLKQFSWYQSEMLNITFTGRAVALHLA